MKDFYEFRANLLSEELSPRIAITIKGLRGNIKKLQDYLHKNAEGIQFELDIEPMETDREEYKGNTVIFSYMDDLFDSDDIKDIFKTAQSAAKDFTNRSKNGNDPIYKAAEVLKMTSGKPFVYSAKLVR